MAGISQAAPHCLMKGGKEISKKQNVKPERELYRGDASPHAEQASEFRQMPSHMKKVTGPLNWVLCLFCSEDRVIEHYTQIKGLSRGQAIVQWVWHLLICEDDIFTFFFFVEKWQCRLFWSLLLVSARFFFIELYFKVKLFEVLDFIGFQLSLCVLIQIPQL